MTGRHSLRLFASSRIAPRRSAFVNCASSATPFDVKLGAAAGITDVTLRFGLYDELFVVDDVFEVNGGATGGCTVYFRARFVPLGYDFSACYARCKIAKVLLANGTQCNQEPTHTHTDWKGDPDR